jgi:hypothetical protein
VPSPCMLRPLAPPSSPLARTIWSTGPRSITYLPPESQRLGPPSSSARSARQPGRQFPSPLQDISVRHGPFPSHHAEGKLLFVGE